MTEETESVPAQPVPDLDAAAARARLDKDRVERVATAILAAAGRPRRGEVGDDQTLKAVQFAEYLVALIDSRGYGASALESFSAGMKESMEQAAAAASAPGALDPPLRRGN